MRPRSLRARITAAGVVALALVLGIGGWVTAATLSASLRADTEAQNDEVLDRLAEEIVDGADPRALRIPAGADGTEFLILDAEGRIVNAGIAPFFLQDLRPVDAGQVGVTVVDPTLVDPTTIGPAVFDAVTLGVASPIVVSSEAELRELLAAIEASTVVNAVESELTAAELAELESSGVMIELPGSVDGVAVGGSVTATGTDPWFETQRAVASPTSGELTLIARSPFAITSRSIDRLTTALWIIVPALVVLGGLAIWWIVGRALRPVRQIADEAGRIAPSNSGDRLPVPGSGDELAGLTVTLNEMLDRLDEGLVRQRQFVSDASHELRSPVTAVKGAAELVATDPALPGQLRPTMTVLGNGVRRLEAVLEDLTELAESTTTGGATHPDAEPGDRLTFDLADVVADAVARVDAPPEITVRVATEGVQVVGHEVRLGRAIENLVRNAIAHAASSVAVDVSALDSPGRHCGRVVVDDDGPGIPPADRARVFGRFVRLDDGRSRHHGGTGLGLAIVASIAAEHGATIVCDESPSGGARFVFEI